MPPFVHSPGDQAKKIPAITLQELSDALVPFLAATFDFQFARVTIDSDREAGTTLLTYYGQVDPATNQRATISALLDGKAAQSGSSRLWNMPFAVSLDLGPHPLKWLWIEPLEKRQIAIHTIASWEKGVPILAD